MKKLLALTLAGLLALSCAACKPRNAAPKTSGDVSAPPAQSQSQPEETGSAEPEPADKLESGAESRPEPEQSPEERVTAMLTAIQTGSRDEIQKYVDYDSLLKLDGEMYTADWHLQQVFTHMSFHITGSRIDGDTASVAVQVKNINMEAVLPAFFMQAGQLEMDNAMSGAPLTETDLNVAYIKLFSDIMYENTSNTLERDLTVALKKFGDGWTILPDEDLRNAVLGNYFAARAHVGEGGA